MNPLTPGTAEYDAWEKLEAEESSTAEPPSRADELLRAVRDGAWLDGQTFPPLRYAVPGLLPEGFTLLIGPPKAGKSWLILAVLLALSTGGLALGCLRVPKGRVLYLALEDGDRRMQDRARNLMGDEPLPPAFHYATMVGPMDVLAIIEAFVDRYPDTVLVVLDTLGKVMPPAFAGETTYSRDYRVGGRIKLIADQHPGLAVVALHHDRKAASDDFVDRVSGTNGLAGAADTILVLSRERHANEGTIAVTGRDVVEAEYALTMAGGAWALDGNSLMEAAQKAATATATAGLGDSSAAVVALVNSRPAGVRAAEVALAVGLTAANAKDYLARLERAGRIAKSGRGLYTTL